MLSEALLGSLDLHVAGGKEFGNLCYKFSWLLYSKKLMLSETAWAGVLARFTCITTVV